MRGELSAATAPLAALFEVDAKEEAPAGECDEIADMAFDTGSDCLSLLKSGKSCERPLASKISKIYHFKDIKPGSHLFLINAGNRTSGERRSDRKCSRL